MGQPPEPQFPRLCRPHRQRARSRRRSRSSCCRPDRRSAVERIVTFDGDLDQAVAGQSVTLTFADEIDCSRGDLIVTATCRRGRRRAALTATLVWMSDEKLVPHRSYWLKIGTQTVSAACRHDPGHPRCQSRWRAARRGPLGLNDIGRVETRPRSAHSRACRYAHNRQLGGFILIDKLSHATVAAGLVDGFRDANAGLGTISHEVRRGSCWVSATEPRGLGRIGGSAAARLQGSARRRAR